MRFKSLTIKGAVPFPEETTIDFPENRKVALIGDNGAGKSTVFDCIYAALYGDLTKPNGLYSLFKNSKDSMIDLSFDLNGQSYRIKRLIDGIARKQKPYFFHNERPITDGKVADFESLVRSTLGLSEKTYLATVYNSQTQKGNPLGLSDKERRDLLTEILGLDQFDKPFEKVSAKTVALDKEVDALKVQSSTLKAKLQPLSTLLDEKNKLLLKVADCDSEIQKNEAALHEVRQRLANAKANAQQVEELKRQIGVLESQKAKDEASMSDLQAKLKNNTDKLLGQRDQIIRAAKRDTEIEKELQYIEKAKDETQRLIDLERDNHQQELEKLYQALSDAQDQLKTITADKQAHDNEVMGLQNQKKNLQSLIEIHKANTSVLDTVPCLGTELQSACSLLANARNAKSLVGDKEKEASDIDAQLTKLMDKAFIDPAPFEAKIKDYQERLAASNAHNPIAQFQAQMAEINDDAQKLKSERESLKALVDLKPHLEGAEERIAGYQRDIEQIKIRLESNIKALAEHRAKLSEAQDLMVTVAKCESDSTALEHELKQQQNILAQIHAQIGKIDTLIEQSTQTQQELDNLSFEIIAKTHELSVLEFLKEALGPKGARALKIDSAGPEISELVNALLRECYGSRFTIQIKTLRELQSGDLRESLEFSIIDNETGEETPVENKSGGEQQLIKEVISLGLCIFQRQRTGIDTRTIIRDEACSALTEENTEKYVKMLDRACEIGGFDQVLYVSHKSGAQQLADAVIEVSKGKLKVVKG